MSLKAALWSIVQSAPVKAAALPTFTAALGWFGKTAESWWSGRERYQAHVDWRNLDTMYGPQDTPIIVIQSIHKNPINVTRLRIRNGFRWKLDVYPYDSEDPDYPQMPRTIEPGKSTMFTLSTTALEKAARQSRFLQWLWVPRVYVGVTTMGRGERLFVAEGGLSWDQRRSRYRH